MHLTTYQCLIVSERSPSKNEKKANDLTTWKRIVWWELRSTRSMYELQEKENLQYYFDLSLLGSLIVKYVQFVHKYIWHVFFSFYPSYIR